ncbi:hypothetical protein [Cohnella soli]|uniref:L-arabinose isomerase n=1 Tax=Cohnella soli TaxID=425005 RepID=A0ABW0HN33_9BACL
MTMLKIGLLPLYIKLYDDSWPELRTRVDGFVQTISDELANRGLQVHCSPVCRIAPEFAEAVASFEAEQVDAIVTLHVAYSPSLESASVLASTRLPLIVLDTTPTFDFSPTQHPDEILYNHGIHGVQDMCNLLIRNGKSFLIEAGHWEKSDVLDRVAEDVKAAKLAQGMRQAKVGRLGESFHGMGDFAVPSAVLQSTIGIETIALDPRDPSLQAFPISEEQLNAELEKDKNDFHWHDVNPDVYRRSIRDCLSVRAWIEQHNLTAFTVNFMDVTEESAISSMPFLEASKAMGRGIGYAGEGDVLTAALTGALLSVYPDTSFTEMFCPDWEHNSIFLSHMGEMNLRVAAQKPDLLEKDFPFTSAANPVVAYGRFRGGKAVYVCLAPGKDQSYTLILSQVDMLDVEGDDRMRDSIHGWFRPAIPVSDYLAAFSRHGGIHHGVIVYGDVIRVMERFGEMMGWHVVKIG